MKRALISVSDKAGIVDFAKELKILVGTLFQLVGLRRHLMQQVLRPLLLMM